MVASIIGSIVAFVVALTIGGLTIYLGARIVLDVTDYSHAVVTAVLGAVAWTLVSWIPLLGPLIALVVWVGVINWRYPGGWVQAAIVGVVAWLAAVILLFLLNVVFGLGVGAFGVPGA